MTARAFARAALAGNPSDGYGGRTLAVVIRDFTATAHAAPANSDELSPPGPGGEALMRATLDRFRHHIGERAPVALRCETTVPREVGLAGSSAIVIACARALCELHGAELERDELARLALAVESEDLGIAAGLQDRMVQARETLVAMDFGGHPVYEELDPALLPPLFVAWHPDAAAPSGVAHAELRARHERGDPQARPRGARCDPRPRLRDRAARPARCAARPARRPGGDAARAGNAHPGDRSRHGRGAHAPDRSGTRRVRAPLLRRRPARPVL